MHQCSVCHKFKFCIVTEDKEIVYYYCEECYAKELGGKVIGYVEYERSELPIIILPNRNSEPFKISEHFLAGS